MSTEAENGGQVESTTADVPVDRDVEKRGGQKEMAANSEVMSIEKNKPSPEVTASPSFFVTKKDRHRVSVDILSGQKDGRIVSVSRVGLGLNFADDFAYLKHSEAWFEFSVPNYEDMTTYRQRSATWRKEAHQMVVDKLQLRNFLLVWHLKDWSLTDESGNKVVLACEENGALTDESVAKVYAVNPTMMDVVMTLFEKDILLT